jgi:hypothetical protein
MVKLVGVVERLGEQRPAHGVRLVAIAHAGERHDEVLLMRARRFDPQGAVTRVQH